MPTLPAVPPLPKEEFTPGKSQLTGNTKCSDYKYLIG